MPDGGDRALHNENICACLLRDLAELSRALGNAAHRSQHTTVFDLAHARRD